VSGPTISFLPPLLVGQEPRGWRCSHSQPDGTCSLSPVLYYCFLHISYQLITKWDSLFALLAATNVLYGNVMWYYY